MAPSDPLAYSSTSKNCCVSPAVPAGAAALRRCENAAVGAGAGAEQLVWLDGGGFHNRSSRVWMRRENSLSDPDSLTTGQSGRGNKQRESSLTRSCAVVTAKLQGGDPKKARLLDTVNRLIRTGTERVPLGGVPFGGAILGRDDISRGQDFDDEMPVGDNDERPGHDPGRIKKLLILMSETGGGHRASAEAIKATFELEYGDEYQVNIIDLWQDHCPWPWNQVPKTYSFMVKHEALWKLAYHSTYPRCVHQSQMAATSTFVARQVTKGFQKYKPDVIVSVHPLMQHVPLRILRAKGLLGKIPFTTVITDLNTCHPTWFHRSVNKCFCPTPAVEQRALQAGLRPSQVRVHGLPIRPAFSRSVRPKAELRKELDLDDDLPAVLLVGGGEGMGPVEKTARALLESLYDKQAGKPIGQLVVICGRNKKLVKKLGAIDWKIPVKIQGFVSNMPEWMGACDCVISKAGPGTIAEAMICGLPMVLNSYIAGQEVGNVSFVVDNAAGKFTDKPVEIASIIAGWFGEKSEEFKEAARNAAKLGRPDAVFRIVHDIDNLVRAVALRNGTSASVWI